MEIKFCRPTAGLLLPEVQGRLEGIVDCVHQYTWDRTDPAQDAALLERENIHAIHHRIE